MALANLMFPLLGTSTAAMVFAMVRDNVMDVGGRHCDEAVVEGGRGGSPTQCITLSVPLFARLVLLATVAISLLTTITFFFLTFLRSYSNLSLLRVMMSIARAILSGVFPSHLLHCAGHWTEERGCSGCSGSGGFAHVEGY